MNDAQALIRGNPFVSGQSKGVLLPAPRLRAPSWWLAGVGGDPSVPPTSVLQPQDGDVSAGSPIVSPLSLQDLGARDTGVCKPSPC